jgi:hypothetical protein
MSTFRFGLFPDVLMHRSHSIGVAIIGWLQVGPIPLGTHFLFIQLPLIPAGKAIILS